MIILLFVNIQFSMFLRSLCEVKRLKTIPSQRSLALEFILHQCHGTNPPEAAGSWLPTSAVAKAIAKQWPRWQPGWPAHPAKCHERLETNTTENHHTKNSGRFQNIYQTQFHPISGVSMLKLQIFRSFFFEDSIFPLLYYLVVDVFNPSKVKKTSLLAYEQIGQIFRHPWWLQ